MREMTGRPNLQAGRRFAAAALTLALAMAPPPLLAQAPPQGQPPSIDAQISQLHQRLAITPAQEGAFAAFANVMRDNARAAQGLRPPGPNISAVDGLRLSIQALQLEVTSLQKMLPALQTLYGTLSPQQKATADQVFNQPPGN